MKHIIIIYDGMADEPLESLNGMTPMEWAYKPLFDTMGSDAEVGLVHTVPPGQPAGSDNTNLSILGYDPLKYYTGRSPIEAVSMGVPVGENDVTMRCNLVTLSDEETFEEKRMLDYAGGEITTEEARVLMAALQIGLGSEAMAFYAGVQYRHCLLWKGAKERISTMKNTPPHDILDEVIARHLPSTPELVEMMERSHEILKGHPINIARLNAGKRPANSIWFWGEGTKPVLPSFEAMTGMKGSVISAVDLLKGIGKLAGMRTPKVPGATDWIDTNYDGEARAAVEELKNGCDFVLLHFEATDEAGHRGDAESKIRGIELIDERVLPIVLDYLDGLEDYALMILPDHPTPIAKRTHTSDPVPYMMFRKSWKGTGRGVDCVSEKTARETGQVVEVGHELMKRFLGQ